MNNNFRAKKQIKAVNPITALNYSLKNLSNIGQPLFYSRKTINQLIEGLEKNPNANEMTSLAKESLQAIDDISYNINKILASLHKIGHTLYDDKVADMEYNEEDEEIEIS